MQLIDAATAALREARATDPEAPLRIADDYLHGMGHALFAWCWARITRAVLQDSAGAPGTPDNRRRLEVARFGRDWLLPAATWRWQRVHDAQKLELTWVA